MYFRACWRIWPADTGFAIVFVQHLDPNHQGLLAEIPGRATAMPVMEAGGRRAP
jgi:two-component system CheB/CheR fusion protein